MIKDAVKIAQMVLAKGAGYRGRIDGSAGRKTRAAALRVPGARPAGWGDMKPSRRAIAAAQMVLQSSGYPPGPIDGRMGPQTEAAADAFLGEVWSRPSGPVASAGSGTWGTEVTIRDVFGPPGGADCTRGQVRLPWPSVLAWDRDDRVRTFGCHALVANSLQHALDNVADTYKPEEIRSLGLHLYGGCYNLRRKRGGGEWSTHAYGVAVDFDPLRNRLRWGADRARLGAEDATKLWQCFEVEGWTSLGRVANFDWMHVQAPGV